MHTLSIIAYRLMVTCFAITTALASIVLVDSSRQTSAIVWTCVLLNSLLLSWFATPDILKSNAHHDSIETNPQLWLMTQLCKTAWWMELAYVYGVINDILGCYTCMAYWAIGHRYGGTLMVHTTSEWCTAAVWSLLATAPLALIVGAISSLCCTPKHLAKMWPWLVGCAATVIVVAHLYSQSSIPIDPQGKGTEFWLVGYMSKWDTNIPDSIWPYFRATNIRNAIGYRLLPLGAIGVMVAYAIHLSISASRSGQSSKKDTKHQ